MQSDLDRQKRSHTQKKHTSAGSFTSALAESTISFNTLATGLSGITGDGIRLSQFPPPPDAVPTPESTNFPSPIGTGSSVAALNAALAAARSHQSSLRGSPRSIPPSPGPAPPAPHPPSSFYPFPSPYGGQFPETSLISPPPMARRPSRSGDVQVMPTDWHDGSSSIDVQPYEARMLSTNAITDLLSSADSAISSGSEIMSPDPVQRKVTRYTSVSQFSEMTYPPPPPPRFPPHLSSQLDQIHDMLVSTDDLYHTPSPHTDNDTIASFDGFAEVVRHAGVSRKVSVVGMAPARVTQFSSETAPSLMAQSLRESVTTYDSSHPLQQSLIIPRTTEELEASPVPSYSRRNQTPPSASRTARARRTSTTSNKSMKSQVSSLIYAAGESAARMARSTTDWLRSKPLPPVPIVRNMTLQEEQQHKQRDLAQPLPNLAQRADRLNTMLGQGRLPANSMYSGDMLGSESYEKIDAHDGDVRASGVGLHSGGRKRTSVGGATAFAQHGVDAGGAGGPGHPPQSRPGRIKWPGTRKAKIKLALVVGVAVVIVAVAIGIGIGVSHAHNQHNCSGNMTGAACTLDATCVCVQQSGQSGCTPVAASLINLVPTVNKNFNTNFSSSDVAASVLAAFEGTTDCFAQARVVDVATALDESIVPNRTTWAQSALMWSFVQSQSTSSVAKLQSFVRGANWASVQNIDGPIPSASSRFSTTTMGFTFDFAGQTITEPSILFATDGQASKGQLSRVDQTTTSALNKVYSAASAMSTLYSTAIQTYWTSILKRNAKDCPTFVSLLIGSPVLLPFNATDIPIATLLASATSSSSFPPPASCYPGLPSTVLEQLSAVETEVFGLSSPGPQTVFDPACFPDRPIYGVLDYLRLRLPFPDSSSNSPVQAAVLAADVRPRVVIANGPQFSAFASSSSRTPAQVDVLQYGTMTHLNHIIMNFFAAIPNVDLANALVDYVLSQSSIPPDSSSLLVQNIASLPVLEATVLGTVLPSDVDAVYSSFATPSGALFFGTDGSLATRKWAINVTNSFVAWTESATASQVVHDNSFTDSTFNSVWDPAFQFFHSSTGSVVNVGNITGAFQAVHKFSSS